MSAGELEGLAQSGVEPHRRMVTAKALLALADGASVQPVRTVKALGSHEWRRSCSTPCTPCPEDGSAAWSTRTLAARHGVGKTEHPPGSWRLRLRGVAMPETRRQYDPEFKAGAVQTVRETRRPVAEIARELGIGAGTLGNWVRKDRIERGEAEGLTADERAELARLRRRCAELEMERDVLKRSVALWGKETT